MLDKEILIEDLALLVRKLGHRLKQARQGDELAVQAVTFLMVRMEHINSAF